MTIITTTTKGRPPRRPISVKLTTDEVAAIRAKARSAGLPASSFLRSAALGRRVIATVPELNRQAYADLARLSANLNQLTRLANSNGRADAMILPAIRQAADECRALRLALIGDIREDEA